MLSMRTNHGVSEQEYYEHCKSDWKPIYRVLCAFQEKGWAVREEDGQWHFTVSGFLISNTLIGILLETQANARLDNTPWMYRPDRKEEAVQLPKGEHELFTEMYQNAVKY